LAAIGLYGIGREGWRRHRFMLLILLFGAVQVAAYSIKGAPAGYFWYLAPGNLALDLLIAYGAFAAWRHAMGWARERFGIGGREGAWSVALAVVVLLTLIKFSMAPMTLVKAYRLGPEYRAAGEWIQSHTPPGQVVAA